VLLVNKIQRIRVTRGRRGDLSRLRVALCAVFAAGNISLSLLSQALGPRFYGFGFAVSAALTAALSLQALSHRLDRLEYETFMR